MEKKEGGGRGGEGGEREREREREIEVDLKGHSASSEEKERAVSQGMRGSSERRKRQGNEFSLEKDLKGRFMTWLFFCFQKKHRSHDSLILVKTQFRFLTPRTARYTFMLF
jgi:hypothetical protein